MQPTKVNERYQILDVLRGFALLGVMIANMAYHSGYWFLSPEKQEALGHSQIGAILLWLIHFITEGKFYSIFSLLFGIGFGLQIQRSLQKNVSFVGRFRRRLLILFLFGLLHAFFLFVGDILTVYAFLGFVLILFRNCSNKTLLQWAFLLPIIPLIQYAVVWGMAQGTATNTGVSGNEMFEQIVWIYQNGTVAEIIQTNFFGTIFGRYPDLVFTGRFFKVLALFILGFYIAKNRWFAEIPKRKAQLKRILIWCAIIGIPCNLILAYMMTTNAYYNMDAIGILEPLVYTFGVPALGLCYTCGIALAYQKDRWKTAFNVLAPFGRMALTNYLMQSVLCVLLFKSYGLGYFAMVSPLFFTLIGITILIIQIIYSNWWLSKYQYGPAEWLWRSITYRKWQLMKISSFKTVS